MKPKARRHPILWAPWRKKYVTKVSKKMRRCILCTALKEHKDKKNLVVKRNKHAFAMLNLYPYNNGHLMVMPKRHVRDFEKLSDEELLDLMRLQSELLAILKRRLKPHGFNLGVNLGRAGGAGVLGHIHIHVVPRWIGDTNFMPMIGRLKVLPESLSSLYGRLTKRK